MAASRGGQLTKKGPHGAWLHHGEDSPRRPTGGKNASLGGHPSTARRGQNACNGGAKRENFITGRTPIDGPQGAKLPVMEEQNM